MEGLKPFGFGQSPAELSTIYRVLRDLEERGLAVSQWDTSNAGPARRQYRITEAGDEYLHWWAEGLRDTDKTLHSFLDSYDRHMEEHQ
jgi:DNA-binding PadR family transcriptional regulator